MILADIEYSKINETTVELLGDKGIIRELNDYFSFDVPNKQFNPKFRAHLWDGKIRLVNLRNSTTLVGLLPSIVKFCMERNYEISDITPPKLRTKVDSVSKVPEFIESLNLPFTPRDYQVEGLMYAIQAQRGILLSPTGCLKEGTKVVMNDGSLKNVEDVVVGDKLLSTNGKPSIVQSLYHGREPLYKIKPVNSKPITVNKDHVLYLYNEKTKDFDITTVDDWCNTVTEEYRDNHYLYSNSNRLEFENDITEDYIGIDPTIMGLFLGVGFRIDGMTLFINTDDSMDIVGSNPVQYFCKENDFQYLEFFYDGKKGVAVLGDNAHKKNLDDVKCRLYDILTKRKNELVYADFIPEEILTAPSWYRERVYEALLMCGSESQNRLFDDIRRLTGSLGYGVSPIEVNGKLHVGYDVVARPKIEKFSVEKLEEPENWYGFELDNNHLFFNDDYTVLHNSGKSLTIYMIVRWHLMHDRKIVIVVPSIGLVEQMISDFKDYAKNDPTFDVAKEVKGLHGKIKTTDPFTDRCVVSTWQSLKNYDKSLYETWDVVIGDEAHKFSANVIRGIAEGAINAPYRIGLTGSLSSCVCHEYQLTGSFGAIKQLATTNELQNRGQLNQMKLYMIDLKYPENECKQLWKETKALQKTYKDELDFVNSHPKRQLFIRNLACSLKGTTLVLFRFREHGELLYNLIKEKVGDTRPVFHIDGLVKSEEREAIRKASDDGSSPILVFSVATSSTGINIKSIENLIICPNKSKITTLQSIGRCLRLADNKGVSNVFDIVDDLRTGRRVNYMFKHASERIEIYTEQNFDITFKDVKL